MFRILIHGLPNLSDYNRLGSYKIVSDSDDIIYNLDVEFSDNNQLLISFLTLDVQVITSYRRIGYRALCTIEGCNCCPYTPISFLHLNYYNTDIIIEKDGGLGLGVKISGFGYYFRYIVGEWMKQVNLLSYIHHGAEAETPLAYAKHSKFSQMIFYGMPNYNDLDYIIDHKYFNFNKEKVALQIKALSNGLLEISEVMDTDFSYESVVDDDEKFYDELANQLSSSFDVHELNYARFNKNKSFNKYPYRNINVKLHSDILLVKISTELNMMKFVKDRHLYSGYRCVIIFSKTKLFCDSNVISKSKNGKYFAFKYVFQKVINDAFTSFNFRNMVQRKYIRWYDMFEAYKFHLSNDEINIALASISNSVNLHHWGTNSLQFKNFLILIPDEAAAMQYVSLSRVEHDMRFRTLNVMDYKDLLIPSRYMILQGFNCCSLYTMETLISPKGFKPAININMFPGDIRAKYWTFWSDKYNGCSIQNAFTSPTISNKSFTASILQFYHVDNDRLHLNRFDYLNSKYEGKLKFKVKGMWSIGYYFRDGVPKFVDYSGHLANVILTLYFTPRDINTYLAMIKNNTEGYNNNNFMYFGINTEELVKGSVYKNIESRDRNVWTESLWHSKSEYIYANQHAQILSSVIFDEKIDYKLVDYITTEINKIEFPLNVSSVTVLHDQYELRQGKIILEE